jgi:hypothetical protein
MGKRSDFERNERDFYETPLEGVKPLLVHLEPNTKFVEPCGGKGKLIDHLVSFGHECVGAYDVHPLRDDILVGDATTVQHVGENFVFITNPPWDRKLLHPMIENLSDQAPTWLLFDADWLHTKQSIPFLPRLRKVVSIGRLKWIPDSKMTGKDNCAWYLFEKPSSEHLPIFYGRTL